MKRRYDFWFFWQVSYSQKTMVQEYLHFANLSQHAEIAISSLRTSGIEMCAVPGRLCSSVQLMASGSNHHFHPEQPRVLPVCHAWPAPLCPHTSSWAACPSVLLSGSASWVFFWAGANGQSGFLSTFPGHVAQTGPLRAVSCLKKRAGQLPQERRQRSRFTVASCTHGRIVWISIVHFFRCPRWSLPFCASRGERRWSCCSVLRFCMYSAKGHGGTCVPSACRPVAHGCQTHQVPPVWGEQWQHTGQVA